MCWVNIEAIRQVAKEDIKVFKIGVIHKGVFHSLYKDFIYRPNQLYITNIYIDKDDAGRFVGSRGFHSYDPSIAHLKVHNDSEQQWEVGTSQGMLDCDLRDDYNWAKAECIIPKGGEYYKNNRGEIISNQIITKNVESIWN